MPCVRGESGGMLRSHGCPVPVVASSAFAGFRFPAEVIVVAVCGSCGSGSRSATSKSSWLSGGSRSITSPCTGGCSASHQCWLTPPGPGDTVLETVGIWTRPTSGSPAAGVTCIGPSTSTARSSTSTSQLGATPRRRDGSSRPRSARMASPSKLVTDRDWTLLAVVDESSLARSTTPSSPRTIGVRRPWAARVSTATDARPQV